MKRVNRYDGLIYIFLVVTIFFTFIRLFMGAEISDEAFYTAEAYLVSKGGVPFVNNWSQAPGATIIYAILVKIYSIFVPDMAGSFLYMRIMFGLYRILIFVVGIFLFRKYKKKEIIILCFLALIPYWYDDHIPAFSYHSIPISGLLFTSILLIKARKDKAENSKFIYFLMGIIMALVTMSNPVQIVNCGVFLILICFYSESNRRKEIIVNYIAGGMMTAAIISSYLIVEAGSIKILFNSLYIMIKNNPYFELERYPFSFVLSAGLLHYAIRAGVYLLIGSVVSLVLHFIFLCIQGKKMRIGLVRTIYFRGIVMGIVIGILWEIFSTPDATFFQGTIVLLAVGTVMIVMFSKEKKDIFFIIAIPEFMTCILAAVTVYGESASSMSVFYPTGVLSIYYIYKICTKNGRKAEGRMESLILAIMCVTALVFFSFTQFYREVNLQEQTTKIKSGVYKGIYTSEERADALVKLERYIRTNTSVEDKVLFMDVAPFAYLMTESEFCTPSTWDVSLYSYGFNDPTIYQEYFDFVGQEPTKIIYIDTGRDDKLSILTENHYFTQYVNKNYKLQDVIQIGNYKQGRVENEADLGTHFEIRIYARKN